MIVFDLDGTLIDIRERWYRLHTDLAPVYGIPVMTRVAYVTAKREGISEQEIVGGDPALFDAYETARLARIESEEYLALDRTFPGVHALLAQHAPVIIMSKRHDERLLRSQLESLDIMRYVGTLLPAGAKGKDELLEERYGMSVLKDVPFVSDALEDHEIAQRLGMRPVAVSYGCRSEAYFARHGITATIGSIQALEDFLL